MSTTHLPISRARTLLDMAAKPSPLSECAHVCEGVRESNQMWERNIFLYRACAHEFLAQRKKKMPTCLAQGNKKCLLFLPLKKTINRLHGPIDNEAEIVEVGARFSRVSEKLAPCRCSSHHY